MALLTTRLEHRAELAECLSRRHSLLVICLCAAWCDTCREFLPLLARVAEDYPGIGFLWVDIEDDSALAGDIDIENFPTLAIFRDEEPLFYGLTLAQEAALVRILAALSKADALPIKVPQEVENLLQGLRDHSRAQAQEKPGASR